MRAVLRRLGAVWNFTENLALYVMASSLILLSVLQIWLRNVHSGGLVWGDSALRVIVFWLAMLGAMIATRNRAHIAVDALTHYLAKPMQRYLSRLTSVVAAAVCLFAAWHSYLFVLDEYQYGGAAVGDIPAWLCETVMPLAFGVIGLRFAMEAIWPGPREAFV